MKNTTYTLITGASSGIGKALAYKCAERKMNLLLVALPETGLNEVADEIAEKHGIDVKTFETDLTETNTAQKILNWCSEKSLSVKYLINNAGVGYAELFENVKMNFFGKLMTLNMNAVVEMTHAFIPELKKQNGAGILNVSSMASHFPIPNKTVYAASKSFVFSFSRALNEELKPYKIHVSCLCPGGTPTSEQVLERMRKGGWIHKVFSCPVVTVAEKAISKFLKKQPVIIPNTADKLVLWFSKIIPENLRIILAGKIMGMKK